jgi:hypothetical protein
MDFARWFLITASVNARRFAGLSASGKKTKTPPKRFYAVVAAETTMDMTSFCATNRKYVV